MKKLMGSLLLSGLLILVSAGLSLGASFYLDPMVGGSRVIEVDPYSIKGDASQKVFGVDIPVGILKVGFEYFRGNLGAISDLGIDATGFEGHELKGGLRIFENQDYTLDATLSTFEFDELNPNIETSGTLVGADLTYRFSNKTSAEVTVAASLSAKSDGQNASISKYKLKLNRMLNRNIALAIGYRNNLTSVKDFTGDLKLKISGPMISLSYKF